MPTERRNAMESQIALKDEIHDLFNRYRDLMPGIARPHDELVEETYKDGALSGKAKRLMAMAVALTHGCRGCVLFQADQALGEGAGIDEVLEACTVAISIGGTMASAETTRVVSLLKERGLVE
jgi:AhpD family alkylhydroperoxidase